MVGRVTIRQELGKGMEVARQYSATGIDLAASTQYVMICCPKFRYNVDRLEFQSIVAVAAGANTVDILKDTGTPAAVMAQFDPDTIVAGAAPVEKAVLAAGKGVPAGTPLYMKLVCAAGSAGDPPDVSVIAHISPDIRGYDGELTVGTYE
jgi:hypothetical protein